MLKPRWKSKNMPRQKPKNSTIKIADSFGKAHLTLLVTAGSRRDEKIFEVFLISPATAKSLKALFREKTYEGHELSLAIERHGGLRLRMSDNNVNQGKTRVFCRTNKSRKENPVYEERIEGTDKTLPVKDKILAAALARKPMTSRDLLQILPQLI